MSVCIFVSESACTPICMHVCVCPKIKTYLQIPARHHIRLDHLLNPKPSNPKPWDRAEEPKPLRTPCDEHVLALNRPRVGFLGF